MNEYIATQGPKFLIEWYFDIRGYSAAQDYFDKMSENEQEKIIALFNLMANRGQIFDKTKFMNEGEGIYAFKYNQIRYLCFFFIGKKIIITHAITKKTQKLPSKERVKALLINKRL